MNAKLESVTGEGANLRINVLHHGTTYTLAAGKDGKFVLTGITGTVRGFPSIIPPDVEKVAREAVGHSTLEITEEDKFLARIHELKLGGGT